MAATSLSGNFISVFWRISEDAIGRRCVNLGDFTLDKTKSARGQVVLMQRSRRLL
jgi:hypothetical protein